MKVSVNLIKQLTGLDFPVEKLVEKVGAQLGAVEEVIDIGARYKGIVVAKVVSAQKHPNADKLKVCLIDDGGVAKNVKRAGKGLVEVVCGAPNVAAGQLIAWIPPGATVPSTFDKDPFVLEARELRGVISNGMIASASELAIGDDHSGILVVDEKKARPGQNFARLYELDDTVIDIENKMFTHRPDCFGLLGVAREISGIYHQPFKSPAWYREDAKIVTGSGAAIKIQNEIPKLVPRFVALAMTGVEVGPSPIKLQSYLSRLGIKPINNVVDATNWVMLLTGQPLHAYDLNKLSTGTLGARLSQAGEKLKLIGGKEITLDADVVVITDGQKPLGLGGVMGGADTQVDESTKNIVIECANFDMNLTRKTAMRYGLFTDAATRFTKGQSPRQNLAALAQCAAQIQKTAGAKPGKLSDYKHPFKSPAPIHVPGSFINERLGLSLTQIDMKRLLDNVELNVRRDAGKLTITPPFWRTDLEIPEDVVEEVGRLYGYEHLPLALPTRPTSPAPLDPMLSFKSRIRRILVRAGANEVLTYSFVHQSLMKKVGQDPKNAYHIKNALSPDLQYYRLSLTPSLLEKIHPNIKAGYDKFALFEIGKTHSKLVGSTEEGVPYEFDNLSLVIASSKLVQGAAFYQARQILQYLFDELGLSHKVEFRQLKPENYADDTKQSITFYESSRSASLHIGKVNIGVVGEYKADVRQSLKLPSACAGFEIDVRSLQFEAETHNQYQPLNKYPELDQDITLRHPADTSYAELRKMIQDFLSMQAKEHGYKFELSPLDIFQKPDDKGHKNTTWRISLKHSGRTLTTAETNKLLDELAIEAKNRLNAKRI